MTLRRSFWITLAIAFTIISAMFIPLVMRDWKVKREASRIAQVLEELPQFRELHAEACLRKFTGVLVEGSLNSESELDLLEDSLVGQGTVPIQLVICVGGEMIERRVRR